MDKIAEVKKLEDGTITIRYEGQTKFFPVTDKTVAAYVLYTLTRPSTEVFQNVNSRCK